MGRFLCDNYDTLAIFLKIFDYSDFGILASPQLSLEEEYEVLFFTTFSKGYLKTFVFHSMSVLRMIFWFDLSPLNQRKWSVNCRIKNTLVTQRCINLKILWLSNGEEDKIWKFPSWKVSLSLMLGCNLLQFVLNAFRILEKFIPSGG